jgi:hypothetical protein
MNDQISVDFDNDFEDVMDGTPVASIPQADEPNFLKQLRPFLDRQKLLLLRCAEFHWQIRHADGRLIGDVWPGTKRYRMVSAPAGQRAREGGVTAVIDDLKHYLRGVGAYVEKQPLKAGVKAAKEAKEAKPTEAAHFNAENAIEDLVAKIASRVGSDLGDKLSILADKLYALLSAAPPAPAPRTVDYRPTREEMERLMPWMVGPLPQPAKEEAEPLAGRPTVEAGEELPCEVEEALDAQFLGDASYLVALHALLIRAETVDPKELTGMAYQISSATRVRFQ